MCQALRAALMLTPGGRGDGQLAVCRATQLALECVVDRLGPTVLAVDDVQWLDISSTRALGYALRRLLPVPLGVAVTLLAGLEDPLGLTALDPIAWVVEVRPLARREAEDLAASHAAGPLSSSRLDVVWRLSGGNPLYVVELAGAPEGAEVPATLVEALARRLAAARPQARAAVELAAVLGAAPPKTFRDLGLTDALDAAVEDGTLALSGGQVCFVHPLLAWAAYAGLPPGRRSLLHAEAADRATSVEDRAIHLARGASEPNEVVASLLDAAAQSAWRRHAVESAARFAEHAVRLTPSDEPQGLGRRLVDVAWWQSEWNASVATATADRALALGVQGRSRGRALYTLMETATAWPDYFRYSELARAEPQLDPDLDAMLRSESAWVACLAGGDLRQGLADAECALQISRECDVEVQRGCLATAAMLSSLAGMPHAEARLREAVAFGGSAPRPANGKHPGIMYAFHLLYRGLWEESVVQLDDQEQQATQDGNDGLLALVDLSRAWVEVTRGDATELDRRLDALQERRRSTYCRDGWASLTSLTQARRGDSRALASAALCGPISETTLVLGPDGLERLVHGVLLVSRGQFVPAAEFFERLADGITGAGGIRGQLLNYVPEGVMAMVAAGRADDAEALIRSIDKPTRYEPLASALEALCRGLVAVGAGRRDAVEMLADARRKAEGLDARWLLAHATYAHAFAMRRVGSRRRAAEAFEESAVLYNDMRATPWAERATSQSRSSVPAPSANGALTQSEARVAALVGTGMRNADVAATLFISVATVEAHLTRVYRKLGVQSRAGLAANLRDRESTDV
jgi:DNA-binding CsgD family transcriptional regulator